MVGCMCGTALAMAPAFVVGLLCDSTTWTVRCF